MRVLVVGAGGREHALCWALRRDAAAVSADLSLFAAPGNPGTAELGTNLAIPATAIDELVAAADRYDID
ncbi:MAG: phosphoribosylamine--glycine ligase, partial [Gemmatimonadales bacterium]